MVVPQTLYCVQIQRLFSLILIYYTIKELVIYHDFYTTALFRGSNLTPCSPVTVHIIWPLTCSTSLPQQLSHRGWSKGEFVWYSMVVLHCTPDQFLVLINSILVLFYSSTDDVSVTYTFNLFAKNFHFRFIRFCILYVYISNKMLFWCCGIYCKPCYR